MTGARLLVTGSRRWADREAVTRALDDAVRGLGAQPADVTLVVGDCPTGADQVATQWARRNGVGLEVFRASWRTYGKAAGPIRNQAMVDSGADLALAFWLPGSKGTTHAMTAARTAGVPVRLLSDGHNAPHGWEANLV